MYLRGIAKKIANGLLTVEDVKKKHQQPQTSSTLSSDVETSNDPDNEASTRKSKGRKLPFEILRESKSPLRDNSNMLNHEVQQKCWKMTTKTNSKSSASSKKHSRNKIRKINNLIKLKILF